MSQAQKKYKTKPPIKSPTTNGNKVLLSTETQTKVLWGVLVVYILTTLYGVYNHEPWRDEAQSWLVVRDLDLPGIFKLLPSEGHPPLWYLVLFPLVKLGAFYGSANWLAAFFLIAAVYILLFKTQLPFLLKLFLPFSYFFFFEYSLFARNYCLPPFFIACIISLYPRRFEKPWLFALCVACLFNTHVLLFSCAMGLTLLYIIDVVHYKKQDKHTIGAFVFMCISGLYLLPYMASGTGIFAGEVTDVQANMKMAVSYGLLADSNFIPAIVILVALLVLLSNTTKPLLLILGGIGGVLFILGFKYHLAAIMHRGTIFLVILCAYGIAIHYTNDTWNFFKEQNLPFSKYSIWLLAAVMLWQMQTGFRNYGLDKNMLFSDAKGAADYILSNKLEHEILVGEQAWSASAIAPYLPNDVHFYYSECQRYGTFYINDSCYIRGNWSLPTDNAIHEAGLRFKDSLNKLVFVLNAPVQEKAASFLDLLYATQDSCLRSDEMFYIYKFKKEIAQ